MKKNTVCFQFSFICSRVQREQLSVQTYRTSIDAFVCAYACLLHADLILIDEMLALTFTVLSARFISRQRRVFFSLFCT